MSNKAIELFRQRRTQYALGRNLQATPEQIIDLVKEAVRQAPSSFNSQSSRAVVLLGEQSEKFWELTREAQLASFAAGVGTVLFFEDQNVVKGLQEQFPSYADNFPIWSEQSSGIAQFAVWVAFADAGIGASLQHYNPVVDEAVASTWNIPASWKLRAQMPFGSNEAGFGEKSFMDDAERFLIFA